MKEIKEGKCLEFNMSFMIGGLLSATCPALAPKLPRIITHTKNFLSPYPLHFVSFLWDPSTKISVLPLAQQHGRHILVPLSWFSQAWVWAAHQQRLQLLWWQQYLCNCDLVYFCKPFWNWKICFGCFLFRFSYTNSDIPADLWQKYIELKSCLVRRAPTGPGNLILQRGRIYQMVLWTGILNDQGVRPAR